jgi:hypothetical protein
MAGQHHQLALMTGLPPTMASLPLQHNVPPTTGPGMQAPPAWATWDPQSLANAFSTVTLPSGQLGLGC